MILRINLILVLIIDKIKRKQAGGVHQIFKFTAFFRTKVEAFESTVNDWELKRFLKEFK